MCCLSIYHVTWCLQELEKTSAARIGDLNQDLSDAKEAADEIQRRHDEELKVSADDYSTEINRLMGLLKISKSNSTKSVNELTAQVTGLEIKLNDKSVLTNTFERSIEGLQSKLVTSKSKFEVRLLG